MQVPSGFLLQILNNEKKERDSVPLRGRLRTSGTTHLGVHLETTLHSTMIYTLSRVILKKRGRKLDKKKVDILCLKGLLSTIAII
jgi:hypothetical protein